MRLSSLAIAALALISTGCLDGLDTPQGKAGFITLDVLAAGVGEYAVRPFGVFYDETSLRFNRATPGQCAILPYFDDDAQFNAGKTMNVGENIVTSLPTGANELLPATEFNFTFYRTTAAGGIPLVPGDTMSFTIIGGEGFPATSIADATPESFTYADVPVPTVPEPITLEWTPPTVAGSIINFSLRYADDFANAEVNRQITCWFEDTGAAVIPASFTDGWIRAKDDLREVSATRLRSKVAQVADDVELTMIATLSVPTEPITP
ncbi:MAG TPA: hypothetical protein VFM71_00940 [Gemmatimonadaceae bacterium]|nr:hypothetical protein [Gemmatimonadaceae bacterium]